MNEVKDKKPENLKEGELWLQVDNERKRVEIDIDLAPQEPLTFKTADGQDYLFVVVPASQEILSYGIIERARQMVQNNANFLRARAMKAKMDEAKEKAAIRSTIMGNGEANA